MKRYSSQYSKVILSIAFFLLIKYSYAQWPQWRGPQRGGVSNEHGLLEEWPAYGPKLVWLTDTVGAGFSSAAIQDDMIYTTGKKGADEILTGLDFKGNVIWQTKFGRASNMEWPESRSTPTFYSGKVYAMTVMGDIACVDGRSGKIDWQLNGYEKYEGVSSYNGHGESLLVEDDKLIFTPAGNKTTLVALNRLTGQTVWESESVKDTNYYTSPVLYNNNGKKVIITSTLNYFLVVDLNTGKILHKNKKRVGIIPIIDDDKAFFSDFSKSIMFNLKDYSVISEGHELKNYSNGVVKLNNRIFGTSQNTNNGLVCIDWQTGKALSYNKEIRNASIIAANNMLYCYEERTGRVSLIKVNDDSSTEIVSSFKVKTGQGPHLAHLSVANGFLFIRHGNFILAYDIRQSI